eukprot:TRINITY_DN14965_c0_g1_i2.p1 TRINITY_DN14965_c0_g1~~TRINITY_DN14965_c0_g1_i2.p1  ORF type:complete len:686 (-),score=199.87 TRINITY_DN14965_c0_g1_i2:117-2174(-)
MYRRLWSIVCALVGHIIVAEAAVEASRKPTAAAAVGAQVLEAWAAKKSAEKNAADELRRTELAKLAQQQAEAARRKESKVQQDMELMRESKEPKSEGLRGTRPATLTKRKNLRLEAPVDAATGETVKSTQLPTPSAHERDAGASILARWSKRREQTTAETEQSLFAPPAAAQPSVRQAADTPAPAGEKAEQSELPEYQPLDLSKLHHAKAVEKNSAVEHSSSGRRAASSGDDLLKQWSAEKSRDKKLETLAAAEEGMAARTDAVPASSPLSAVPETLAADMGERSPPKVIVPPALALPRLAAYRSQHKQAGVVASAARSGDAGSNMGSGLLKQWASVQKQKQDITEFKMPDVAADSRLPAAGVESSSFAPRVQGSSPVLPTVEDWRPPVTTRAHALLSAAAAREKVAGARQTREGSELLRSWSGAHQEKKPAEKKFDFDAFASPRLDAEITSAASAQLAVPPAAPSSSLDDRLAKLAAETWQAPDTHLASARAARATSTRQGATKSSMKGEHLLDDWSEQQQKKRTADKPTADVAVTAWMPSSFSVDSSPSPLAEHAAATHGDILADEAELHAALQASWKVPDTRLASHRLAERREAAGVKTETVATGADLLKKWANARAAPKPAAPAAKAEAKKATSESVAPAPPVAQEGAAAKQHAASKLMEAKQDIRREMQQWFDAGLRGSR